jgi:hypothetical protein
MKRVAVIAVVMASLGLLGWVSLSPDTPAEYSAVMVQLAAGLLSTQAEPVSGELNKRAADGWSLVSVSLLAREVNETPVVLLVFSRPGK